MAGLHLALCTLHWLRSCNRQIQSLPSFICHQATSVGGQGHLGQSGGVAMGVSAAVLIGSFSSTFSGSALASL